MTAKVDRTVCTTLGLKPSFGFGDRLGLATPGHVEAMRRSGAGIEPAPTRARLRHLGPVQATREAPVEDSVGLGVPERLARRLRETL